MRTDVDIAVIGGGQAGLACGYYLSRAGLDHVILDRQESSGGAWQATWPSLRLFSSSIHSSLPGRPMPPHPDTFPPVDHALDYLTEYEHRYDLPIERPVRVSDVHSLDDGLAVITDNGTLRANYVINATGTWAAPFVPQVEGASDFRGLQLHSAHYRGPHAFDGQRVAVVGGGNSGVQITADLVDHAEEVSLVSARRLRFLPDDVDGRHLFDQATARLDEGDAEAAFVGNIVALPQVRAARAKGALQLRAMFDRMTPHGGVIGREHLDVDAVIWCTGFRPALRHLRSLGLRTARGIPEVAGNRSVKDPRVCFVGYGDWTGPASATLIGVGRTARSLVARLAVELGGS
ncbi:ArsO family NAD(P)H-dependent flavin-containing monooxygenase [Janibacter cremeus]|uniref:Putative flavoprotein involved in K+ transport n=1 Tax=Janibacter cremeus TaxID=1285192 RepID=A0A852VS47_9MICO|nr:ArsO family NAD(P)H-dependent flavin-containing monooxygenase [Janibacter cremeus]NYF96665.1 putative flavoprotein involved in K+ transport [Janibacter cremeus]